MVRKTLKNIVFVLTLRCDQASRLISLSQDQPLNRVEQTALFFHTLVCRLCRGYRKQLKLMRETLGKLANPQVYSTMASSLLDKTESKALRTRISKKIRKDLDSL